MFRAGFLLSFALAACARATPAPPPKPPVAPVEQTVTFGEWVALPFGSYLAPASGFVAPDGGVDVVWNFHACHAAEADFRATSANVVFACINNLGMGTAPYWDAFNDPARFGKLLGDLTSSLEQSQGRKVHVRSLVLVAWSAGYASVQQILSVPSYYEQTRAVVLLDGLHAGYTKNPDGSPTKKPRLETVGSLLRFAEDAAQGKKVMVFTHSAVVPPDYASTTEMARALEERLQMTRTATDADFPGAIDVADREGLHVRGFEGREAKDHIAQLHQGKPALMKWVLR